jgi:hypothetical protein
MMFIDDERHTPENWRKSYVVLRSYDDVVAFVERNGCPEFISFDHDLGPGKCGYDIALWLINKDIDGEGKFFPENFSYTVHSMNPIGRDNIVGLLDSYLRTKHGKDA